MTDKEDTTERIPPKVTTRDVLSFHSVECFLEKVQVRGIASLLAAALDPFLLESIFRRSVVLIKDAEDAGETQTGPEVVELFAPIRAF